MWRRSQTPTKAPQLHSNQVGRLFLGQTDYQTVELIREARVPEIAELDPALDTIIRKALARDVATRFQTAREFGDALGRYAVSRDVNLKASETGMLVRDVKYEVDYERSAQEIDRSSLARVQESASHMVSILERDARTSGPWN
jgi:eukaryotic-like serine/threonine-protein kinase